MTSGVPAVTDQRGKFLMPGCTVAYVDGFRKKRTGIITVFNHGWARVRVDGGRMVTKKPTRLQVVA